MDKKQIAAILDQIGILLELKGENPFKTRAYSNGARIIKSVPGDLPELIDSGEIRKIKGIGPALSDKISTLVLTGSLPYYENLRKEFPDSLLELLRIPGLGPKKIKKLYDEKDIKSIAELETACKEDRLADLEGFGARMQQKILEGIEFIRQHSERHHFHRALAAAERLQQHINNHPGILRAQVTGSLRRHKETVKDIDVVASAAKEDGAAIMQHFIDMPGTQSVVAHGATKTSIILEEGIQADLRIVSDAEFPFTLHHFTGSKEHNTAMRGHARKLGLKMNEYGLIRDDGSSLECKDEAEIFAALGMAFVPPEMREDQGEIEAALAGNLPELITDQDVRGILHNHSTWSDGANSLAEMAEACKALGMQYFGIADHSQAAFYANGLDAKRLKKQAEEIAALNAEYDNFRIFHGSECDILAEGDMDFEDDVLATLDYVVASVHTRLSMSEADATSRVLRAIMNPYVTILGHPTGRLLLGRDGFPLKFDEIFAAAREYNVAIEINANPHRFDLDWRLLQQAKAAGVRFSINPDAHTVAGLKDTFLGVGIARKGWLQAVDVINTLPLEEITTYFNAKSRK